MSRSPDVGAAVAKTLVEAPLGDMLLSIATGITEAQHALDMAMLRSACLMTGEYEEADGTVTDARVKLDGEEVSLLELGFTPTFYQFTDTTIEVKISLSMSTSTESSRETFDLNAKVDAKASVGFLSLNASVTANVSSVSASFSSKYGYNAEGSSTVRTRLVPVPPPALLEQRLRRSLDKKVAARKS